MLANTSDIHLRSISSTLRAAIVANNITIEPNSPKTNRGLEIYSSLTSLGYSVGDFIAVATIAWKISLALRSTKGARVTMRSSRSWDQPHSRYITQYLETEDTTQEVSMGNGRGEGYK